MKKNVASQSVSAQVNSATDGSPFTGSVTVSVTGDNGTRATGSVGSGACTHEGGGLHSYAPAQAETNYTYVVFQFAGTGAITSAIHIYTAPTTGFLAPTTADRTLDVSAGGEAGVDWANVGSPTTAVDLSGTTIKTTQKVDVDTIKTNPVVNGGTITFPTTATLASTTNITAGTVTTVSGNVNGSVGSVTGAVGSVTGAVGSVTGAVGSVAAGGIAASSFAAGAIDAAAIATNAIDADALAANAVGEILTTAMTEAYATLGAAPTLAQILFEIRALLAEKAVSSTTLTAKKLDGSTTAATYTLDDAVNPSSITRAS